MERYRVKPLNAEDITALIALEEEFDDSDIDPDYIPDESLPVGENVVTGESLGEHEVQDAVEQPQQQSRNPRKQRQISRNCGESYQTASGKTVTKKILKELENCRSMCKNKIDEVMRRKFFDEYWSQGSYDKRVAYISGLINIKHKARERKKNEEGNTRNRTKTFEYHINVHGMQIKMCQRCFLCTFDETDNFIKSVVKKKLATIGGLEKVCDHRGRSSPLKYKWSDEKLEEIKMHILSFPSYESHYCRKQTSKKYLPSHLTLTKMYSMYKEAHDNVVSYRYYSQEFHKLNLSFKKLNKDTCHNCDKLKLLISTAEGDQKVELINRKENHLKAAELAYSEKKADKEKSKATKDFKCFTFDLQQCLPTPALASSVSFYKRQLWTFNLTIKDEEGKSYHCMWYESMAKRGANEIGSCLFKVIKNLDPSIKKIILYSDSCAGQNKNMHVAAMFSLCLLKTNLESIDHKFMTSGHTHMEVDSDHSQIEKKKKKTDIQIHHPHDWLQLVRSVSSKFKVIEMEQNDFLDFASILKGPLVTRNKMDNGEIFKWHDMQWISYRKNYFGKLYCKKSLSPDEPFQCLSILRRAHNVGNIEMPLPLNTRPIPISKEKKKDILDLLELIPEMFHNFYKSIPDSINELNVDPDIFDSDDE